MSNFLTSVLFSCVLIYLTASSFAQDCSTHSFSNNKIYRTCSSLPVLNSFLHWTYYSANHTADIAYRHTQVTQSQWVAWALNIGGTGMLGAQCLVALRNSSGQIHAYTSPISGYGTTLAEAPLSFRVPSLRAEFRNNEMVIYATLELPRGRSSFNHVWQVGLVSSGGSPEAHALGTDNRRSQGTVDFLSGTSSGGGSVVIPRLRRKNVHGVLNAVSWGILMPMGAIIARYMRVFKSADPAWFYLHVACQFSAYVVGVAGWGTGMKLGSDAVGVNSKHRNIGITLFCLGTIQLFALLLRPKKDHKYRLYWNIYHHTVGYTVIILSIINVFEGFHLLQPDDKWKRAYIGILIFLGACALVLEALTWFVVIKRKKSGSDKHPHVGNGTNGVNGYGERSHQAV